MRSRFRFSTLAAAVLAAGVLGCATANKEPLSTDLEQQDIDRMVERMVESLISDQNVLVFSGGDKPVLDIMPIKNKTSADVDMESIVDSLRTRLLRSRQFIFVDRSTAARDVAIMNEQAMLLPNSQVAVQPGKQLAAQMVLDGSLSDMVKSDWTFSRPLHVFTDHSYKFSMRLKDLRTGAVVWSDEYALRKMGNRLFWK